MKTAIFPGSFDPFTLGHHDLVTRGLEIFDNIVILIAKNEKKPGFLDNSIRERLIAKVYEKEKRVIVDSWDYLLIDYAKKKDIKFLIRGIRPSSFGYEFDYAMNIYNLWKLEIVWLSSRAKYQSISSSLVREIFQAGGDVSGMVPPEIVNGLKNV